MPLAVGEWKFWIHAVFSSISFKLLVATAGLPAIAWLWAMGAVWLCLSAFAMYVVVLALCLRDWLINSVPLRVQVDRLPVTSYILASVQTAIEMGRSKEEHLSQVSALWELAQGGQPTAECLPERGHLTGDPYG